MDKISSSRFGRYAQALFNLNSPLTLGFALSDAQPVVDLENPRPETLLFAGFDLAAGHALKANVAAEYSNVSLRLPTAGGRVAVVTSIRASSPVAATTAYFALLLGGGTLGTEPAAPYPQFCDSRRTGRPLCELYTGSSAVSLNVNPIATAWCAGSGEVELLSAPLVLANNTGYVGAQQAPFVAVENSLAVNQSMIVSFRWYERAIGEQERSA